MFQFKEGVGCYHGKSKGDCQQWKSASKQSARGWFGGEVNSNQMENQVRALMSPCCGAVTMLVVWFGLTRHCSASRFEGVGASFCVFACALTIPCRPCYVCACCSLTFQPPNTTVATHSRQSVRRNAQVRAQHSGAHASRLVWSRLRQRVILAAKSPSADVHHVATTLPTHRRQSHHQRMRAREHGQLICDAAWCKFGHWLHAVV